MDRDWRNLEALALSLILDKLKERIDHVWFGAVCKNWQSVAKLNHQKQQFRTHVLPMLLISKESKIFLYSIPSKRMYPLQISGLNYNNVCGYSQGWLATEDKNHAITLLNPFKNVAPISLPPLRHIEYSNSSKVAEKVILSVDPIANPNDYVVVVVPKSYDFLAFMKADQTSWTYIDHKFFFFVDVMFFKGLLYVVSQLYGIMSFDLNLDAPYGAEKIIPACYNEEIFKGYFVKSIEGDLWMLKRVLSLRNIFHMKGHGTESFEVYKLEFGAQSRKIKQMIKLENLGDNVLFVGNNESIAASVSYFNDCLEKDSIYYSDDLNVNKSSGAIRDPYYIRGIYNIKEKSFSHHHSHNLLSKQTTSSFWVSPYFQWD